MAEVNFIFLKSEKSFDKQLIYIVADKTSNGVRNHIEGFHGSSESHFFLKNFCKKRVDENNLKKVGELDFRECCHKAETKHCKYTEV